MKKEEINKIREKLEEVLNEQFLNHADFYNWRTPKQ